MNDKLKHFFISNLVSQTEKAIKKSFPGNNFGEFISMNFMVDKTEKVIQRLVFENYSGDETLTDSDKKRFEQMLSINIHNEMIGNNSIKKECKFIIASINAKTKKINIQYSLTDGTKEIINF